MLAEGGEIPRPSDARSGLPVPMWCWMASQRTSESRVRRRFRCIRRRLSDESGVSLVLVLLVVSALSISTAAMTQLVTSNEAAYGRDRQEVRASSVGEAGLNEGVSYLSNQDNLLISSVSPQTFSLDSGTGQWWADKTATTATVDTWTIYSQATVGKVTRKFSVQLAANKSVVSTPASGVWAKGFFVADPTYCTTMNGTTTMKVSIYIAGDLCLTGTQQIIDPTPSTPSLYLYVAHRLMISGSNATVGIGPPTNAKIAQANIGSATPGGCLVGGVAKICSNGAQSHVYANATIASALTLTKPPIDAPGMYASGDWNNPVCSTGSFTFDNNGTRNSSAGTINLLSGSSYNCTVYKSSSHVAGNEQGTLSWNATTRQLAISGTIYLDGDLNFSGGAFGSYTGLGTIYVNGKVSVSGNTTLCGPGATAVGTPQPHCTGLWDGSLGAIGMVAVNSGGTVGMTGSSCTSPAAWSMSGTAEIDVAAYVVGCFSQTGTSYVTGPVSTDQGAVAGTPTHTDLPNPPPNLPGAAGSTTASSWGHVVPSSWRQLPAS